MRPLLLPVAERLGRFAMRRRGIASRWIDTEHGKVHVYDARGTGSLPPIVLLHGIGSAATPFGPLVGRLQRQSCRVVAPDYPGHGFSQHHGTLTPQSLFDSVRAVLDTLRVGPAIVVGNSLGGAVALQCAIERPQSVLGLVLVSPAGAHASAEEWRDIKRTFHLSSRTEARAFLDRIYHRTPWFLPLLAHEFPAALARPAVRDLLTAASNDHLPAPAALEALPMPILLLWGQSEKLLPDSHLAYFTRHLPKHAIIERPPAYGHCPHFDDPADLSRRIVTFAASLSRK
jgi:pimeloyl-ACP methyl ester carboxylesterase